MAIQLDDANKTGTLTGIFIGGTDPKDELAKTEVTDVLDDRITVTEADIATNVSDIAINTTALTTKLDETVATFTPQADPGAGEGQVFYDSTSHSLSVKNDQDMTLNLGSEIIYRGLNDTGVTIPNGTAVYSSGINGGVDTIAPALADSFATSDVLGVTTHEILDGNQGFVTSFGSLGGDFSAYAIDDTLYLSDTVAGGFVTIAPDIATKVGRVADNAVSGKMSVRIASNIALPTVVGVLNNGSGAATIDGTYQTLANYTPAYSVGVPVDGVTGQITIPTVGLYRLNINLNISCDDTGNQTAVVDLQLWNVTQGAEALVISSSIAKNSEGCALSPTFVYDFLTAGDVYELLVRSTGTTLTGVTYQLVTFDLESVHLRA